MMAEIERRDQSLKQMGALFSGPIQADEGGSGSNACLEIDDYHVADGHGVFSLVGATLTYRRL